MEKKRCEQINRIKYLDGLRGIACMMIVIHHFLLAFYPTSYYGGFDGAHGSWGWDTYLAQAPIAAIFNGDFWVCIFLLLSGFVIGRKIYKCNEREYASVVIKRYLRLALPICAFSMIVFLPLKQGFLYSHEFNEITGSIWSSTHYNNAESIRIEDIFITSLYKVEFIGDTTFSTAFWMLPYLFWGYCISILFAIISKNKKSRILII